MQCSAPIGPRTWVPQMPLSRTGVQDRGGVSGKLLVESGLQCTLLGKVYRVTCAPAEPCTGIETWVTATPIQDAVSRTKQWIVHKDKFIWMNR